MGCTRNQRLSVPKLVQNVAGVNQNAHRREHQECLVGVAAACRSVYQRLSSSSIFLRVVYLHAGQLMACAHRLLAPLGRPSSSSQVTPAQVQLAHDFIKAGLLQAMNDLVLKLQVSPDPSSPASSKVQFLGCGPDALRPAASTATCTATVREASLELLAQLADLTVRITVWVEVACGNLAPAPVAATTTTTISGTAPQVMLEACQLGRSTTAAVATATVATAAVATAAVATAAVATAAVATAAGPVPAPLITSSQPQAAAALSPSPTTSTLPQTSKPTKNKSTKAKKAKKHTPNTSTAPSSPPIDLAALRLELRQQLMTGTTQSPLTSLPMCGQGTTGIHQRDRESCVSHIVLSTILELAPALLTDTRGREGLSQHTGSMASLSLSKHLSALLRADMGTPDPQAVELTLRTTTWLDRAGPATRLVLVDKKVTVLRTQAAAAGLLLFDEGSEALTPATCRMAAACLHDLRHTLQRTPDDGADKVALSAGVMLGVVAKVRKAQSDPQLAAALRPDPGQPSAVVAALLVAALLVGWDSECTRNKMDTPLAPLFPTPSAAERYLETLSALLTEEMRGLIAQHRQRSSQQSHVQTELGNNNTSSSSSDDRSGVGSGAGAMWQAGCGQAAVDAAASISAAGELIYALKGPNSAQVLMRLGVVVIGLMQEQGQAFSRQLRAAVLDLAGAAADVWATPWAGGTAAGSEVWLRAVQVFNVVDAMAKVVVETNVTLQKWCGGFQVSMTHVRPYAVLLRCRPLSLPVAAAAVITRLHRRLGPRARRNPCAASCAGPEMEGCMARAMTHMLNDVLITNATTFAFTPWCPMTSDSGTADTKTDIKGLVHQSMQAACRDEACEGAQFRGQVRLSLMMHGVRWGPAAAQAVRVVLGIAAAEGMGVEVHGPAVCGVVLGLPLLMPTVLKATLLECTGVVGAEALREAQAWLRGELVGVVGSCQADAASCAHTQAGDTVRGVGGGAGAMPGWQAAALARDEVRKKSAVAGSIGDGGCQHSGPPCSLHIIDCLTLLAGLAPPPAPGSAPAAAAASSARPRQSVSTMHAWTESALVLGVQAWSVGACRGLVAQLGRSVGSELSSLF